jgi:histidine triad (HIT) family protein
MPSPPPAAPPCVFCRIVAGAVPAHVVARSDECTAFLDTRPLFPGHTLVVPNEHHVTLPDLPEALLVPVFGLARRIAAVMGDALGAAGTFVAMNNVVSQSVPHLHVHVVPRNRKDGLRGFFWPRTTYAGDDEAAAVAARLAAALTR